MMESKDCPRCGRIEILPHTCHAICKHCSQELKWSMAGWVHVKSGHGVCFRIVGPRAEPKEEQQ